MIVCLISLIAAALKPVVAMNVMSDTAELPKLNPTVLLFYDTGISFFLMLLIWLCSELESSTAYMSAHAGIGLTIISLVFKVGCKAVSRLGDAARKHHRS